MKLFGASSVRHLEVPVDDPVRLKVVIVFSKRVDELLRYLTTNNSLKSVLKHDCEEKQATEEQFFSQFKTTVFL